MECVFPPPYFPEALQRYLMPLAGNYCVHCSEFTDKRQAEMWLVVSHLDCTGSSLFLIPEGRRWGESRKKQHAP